MGVWLGSTRNNPKINIRRGKHKKMFLQYINIEMQTAAVARVV